VDISGLAPLLAYRSRDVAMVHNALTNYHSWRGGWSGLGHRLPVGVGDSEDLRRLHRAEDVLGAVAGTR